MRARTVLPATALALLLLAAPAIAAFLTTPVTVSYGISTAEEFPGAEDPPEGASDKVWICKLVGSPKGEPKLAKTNNPRQVSASAVTDGAFNEAHGSPVVDEGTDCATVWPPDEGDDPTT